MKDIQATGEASSPQKRPSITSNNTFLPFILRIPHMDPDPHTTKPTNQNQCVSMRIRIQNTAENR